MLKKLPALALSLALATPLSSAKAVGTASYDVCGGSYSSWSGFAFCASVQIAVTAKAPNVWNVAMQIANMSGTNGSYAGSLFAQIGIDNILGNLANPANIVVSQNGVTVCTNTYDNLTGNAKCWQVKQDQSAAGGVNVDFLGQTANGVNLSLASACSGSNGYLYTCLGQAPVTISFDINTDFDPTKTGDLYIKAQGALGSTECETGATGAIACNRPPSVTATPEPATLGLMGIGLVGLIPVARRLRNSSESTPI